MWTSHGQGIGYFTDAPASLLKGIGSLTGTEIAVESNEKQLSVSGNHPDDVKEAMERLTRLDQSLVRSHVLTDSPSFPVDSSGTWKLTS
jgi:hypothetical protein